MIFSLLIIHNDDRMSSSARVLHTTTWVYFTEYLPDRFVRSPKVVKEEIMTDINDLVKELWASNDGAIEASFFAMRRLLEVLQGCFHFQVLQVCFDIISFFASAVDFADKNLQMLIVPDFWQYFTQPLDDQIRAKFKISFDGYRKMIDQSFFKSKDLGDMLRFLPGVVVQKNMSMQGMAVLYKIKPDFLERLIKSSIELLSPSQTPYPSYILDDYVSGFLQDQDRSQLYYCDPELQHISICRQFLSLLAGDRSNVFDLQS